MLETELYLLPERVKQIARNLSETDLLDDLKIIERLVQIKIASVERHLRGVADGLRAHTE